MSVCGCTSVVACHVNVCVCLCLCAPLVNGAWCEDLCLCGHICLCLHVSELLIWVGCGALMLYLSSPSYCLSWNLSEEKEDLAVSELPPTYHLWQISPTVGHTVTFRGSSQHPFCRVPNQWVVKGKASGGGEVIAKLGALQRSHVSPLGRVPILQPE